MYDVPESHAVFLLLQIKLLILRNTDLKLPERTD